METIAKLDPKDTGVWEDLAFAAAERGDFDATVRYHQRFIDTTQAKMDDKYGAVSNWPAAAQERWQRTQSRNQALRSALSSGRFEKLRITVVGSGPTRGLALVDPKSGSVVHRLE